MNEPTKENPKTSKRSKRKPAMEPLGWDEIVSQPGMGGYLSFLNGPVPLPHLQGPTSGVVPRPGVESTGATPGVISIPAIPAGRLRIRKCMATHDGHSLGEEVIYQALWK